MGKLISNQGIASLMLELSMLLQAGVSAGDALAVLSEEKEYSEPLAGMAQRADAGASLAQCLRESGRFPAYVCGLIEVGERTGHTQEATAALARYYEGRTRLDRQIRSALLYPVVMLGLMLVVIGVLLVRVLPIFDDVYASLGGRLTGVAGGLLTLGRWLDRAMPVLLILLTLAALAVLLFAAVPAVRERTLSLWRGRRGDKGLARRLNTARLAQALAMGMSSGLQAEEALELAAELLSDTPAARARCLEGRAMLDGGESLSHALEGAQLLPPRACRLLELGQRSGVMDIAMEKIAQDLSSECDAAIEDAVSRVEPALVLACSLLVGLILLSVMMPLMHIMSAIG